MREEHLRLSDVVGMAIERAKSITPQWLTVLAAAGLFVFQIAYRLIASQFYSAFGVAPEEVGIGFGESFLMAAVASSVLLFTVFAFYMLAFTAFIFVTALRTAHRALLMWKQTQGRRREALTYLGHRLVIIAVLIAGAWWSNANGRWFPVLVSGVIMAVLFEVSPENPFLSERAPEVDAQRSTTERDARRVFYVSLVLTIVFAGYTLGQQIIGAGQHVVNAQKGIDVEGGSGGHIAQPSPRSEWRLHLHS